MQMRERCFWVYILTNRSQTLYTGMTNNIGARLAEHRSGKGTAFTAKYKCHRLVYVERFGYVKDAIAREKQIKNMHRLDKIKLVVAANPTWKDLSEEWGRRSFGTGSRVLKW